MCSFTSWSWRYAPVGLRDWGIIAGGDAVLHCLSIPKIEVILGKTNKACSRACSSSVPTNAGQGTVSEGADSAMEGSMETVISLLVVVICTPSSLSMPSTACNTATGVRLARM